MRKKLSVMLALAVALSVMPVNLFAIDPIEAEGALELLFMEIPSVVTASKKQETIKEAPAVVTVITAEEIKDFGASTFYDVLLRLPSIQPIGSHLYPRNAGVIRGDLVGHYDNHLLILINGRPFREDVAGGLNAAFYNMFPLEAIERIEYVHGPGSVLYGTNAFDGVLNVITKKPAKDVEAEIAAGAGSFGGGIGKGTIGIDKNDLNLLASVNYFKDDGWEYKAIAQNPAPGSTVDGSTKYGNNNMSGSVFLKYKDFTFDCYLANLEQKNFGLVPLWQAVGQNGASWLTTIRRFADIGYAKQISGDYSVQVNVTYNYYEFKSYSHESLASNEGAYDYLGEVTLSGPVMDNANIVLGGVLTKLTYPDLAAAKIAEFDQSNNSAYVQLDYKPAEKLKLAAGAQYNKPEDIDAVTVPRIGVVYQISDAFGTKASYAEAFRSPWPVETKTNYPGVLVGNPSLKPEKVKTTDVQFMYNVAKNQSSLTFFNSKYTDLVTRIAHPTIAATSSYDNLGEMEIQGVEVESKVSLSSSLYVEGSGTYQTEKDDKVLAPDYMVKAGFCYRTDFGLKASIFDNYFGKPKENAGAVVNPEAKAVNLVSVNLIYTVPSMESLSVNVFVQNALDQDYYYPEFSKGWVNTLPLEPGRAVYSTVSYKF
ncbi:MAG: TonB-dependent receptor [Endomicrobiales bacterium]|nr:TonB-dependent receptor [Endomicrobiales bacterium]